MVASLQQQVEDPATAPRTFLSLEYCGCGEQVNRSNRVGFPPAREVQLRCVQGIFAASLQRRCVSSRSEMAAADAARAHHSEQQTQFTDPRGVNQFDPRLGWETNFPMEPRQFVEDARRVRHHLPRLGRRPKRCWDHRNGQELAVVREKPLK